MRGTFYDEEYEVDFLDDFRHMVIERLTRDYNRNKELKVLYDIYYDILEKYGQNCDTEKHNELRDELENAQADFISTNGFSAYRIGFMDALVFVRSK